MHLTSRNSEDCPSHQRLQDARCNPVLKLPENVCPAGSLIQNCRLQNQVMTLFCFKPPRPWCRAMAALGG